jgi:hypothetical protein
MQYRRAYLSYRGSQRMLSLVAGICITGMKIKGKRQF